MDVGSMIGTGGLGGVADLILTGTWWFVKILLLLAACGLAGFWWYMKKKYVYQVKLKILQNDQLVYYQDVARRVDEAGAGFWYIKGLKEKTSIPPGKSMYLGPKGGWVAEGYYDRTLGVIWATDVEGKQKLEALMQRVIASPDTKGQETVVDRYFQPLTSTQRSLQSQQITKAARRLGKDIWSLVLPIASMALMVIVIALILIFWNDIYKPVAAVQGQNIEISKTNAQIQEQNLRFYMMLTGGKGNGTYIVQELTDDQRPFPAVSTTPLVPAGGTP